MVSSFEKRVKRHVSGRLHDFFVITAPELERLCHQELTSAPGIGGAPGLASGGVAFQGKLYDDYIANLYSRTATRILMRIGTIVATRFDRLSKKLSDIPWELYLPLDAALQIHVTTHHCRLYHKDAIAGILENSIRGRLSGEIARRSAGDADVISQRILVRGMDDCFQVSVDSSGDLLYKRGLKTTGGRAPLRETLAAAILMLAGYTGREPLIDPMCGSGTFSIEAALMGRNIPPGWFRSSFAFMNWPGFRSSQWHHIRNEAEKNFNPAPCPVFASDTSPDACNGLNELVNTHESLRHIQTVQRNFLDLNPADMTRETGVVVINPPYGKRMGVRRESHTLIQDIMKKLKSDYRGWKFALVIPERTDIQQIISGWEFHPIYHGGLKLELLTGRLPS